MISLDYSVVYQIILFVVLWLILNKVLFQPYLHLLEERERKTTGAQHDSAGHTIIALRVAEKNVSGLCGCSATTRSIGQNGFTTMRKTMTTTSPDIACPY